MKRAALRHPKTKRLARELQIPLAQAIGTLALLWEWTGEYCPQGDVGRFTDADIAEACGWTDDAGRFVQALTNCGWLDRHEIYRLLIHDWPDHCEQFVTRRLARANLKHFTRAWRLADDGPRLDITSQAPVSETRCDKMQAQLDGQPCLVMTSLPAPAPAPRPAPAPKPKPKPAPMGGYLSKDEEAAIGSSLDADFRRTQGAGAAGAGGNGGATRAEIITLLGDRGCDESLRGIVAKIGDVRRIREIAVVYDATKRRIRNPGGWWRRKLQAAGIDI